MFRALLVAMFVIGGCRDPKDRTDGGAAPVSSAPPRYWLRQPDETAPRLVEVTEGYVVDPDEPSWRAPWAWPAQPQPGQGLMLYAQRVVTLRHGAKPSNVILHPGALVAVVPTDGGYFVAPGPPAVGVVGLFADADALGSNRVAPAPEANTATLARATSCWWASYASGGEDMTGCVPVLLGPKEGQATQRFGFVEKRGSVGPPFYSNCYHRPVAPVSLCSAAAITRDSAGFRFLSGGYELTGVFDAAMATIPDGYREIEVGETTLARWLQRPSGSFFVLMWQDETVACVQVSFTAQASDRGIEGTLHDPGYDDELVFGFDVWAPYRTATLTVSDPQNGTRADTMFVVGSFADEVHVLHRHLHRGARFYLETEAERWFATADVCEAAAARARKRIDADQRQMLSVGLHAPFDSRLTAWFEDPEGSER